MKNENYTFGRHLSYNNDSRWADSEEMKEVPTLTNINIEAEDCTTGGIPIISDGSTAFVDGSDTHTIIFGSTGSKKTRLFGMPLINILAMAGESFVTTDPKGELFNKTSGLVQSKGYKTVVLNFRDLNQSDLWNPLAIPYELYHNGRTEEAISLINDLVATLAEPQRSTADDKYWIEMSVAQALANLLFFIDTATPEEANIYSFSNFFVQTCTPAETERLSNLTTTGSIASLNYKSVLTNKEAEKTFANVSSGVSNMLNPFIVRKTLCQVLSKSSFDLRNLGKEKTAIYIIIPDEKTTLHVLVTMFIKQTYEILINEAQSLSDRKLPNRVNFVLDEFANIPKIPDMASMISAARSRNMRFFLIAQSQWQLLQKYGNDAHTIKGNCDNWVFLTSRERDLLEEFSFLCGNRSFIDPYGQTVDKKLITTSQLQRFKKEYGETLILHGRNYPFVTELPDIDEYKFKELPAMRTADRILPQITLYDHQSVIQSIEDGKRAIPFSVEVHGEEKFMKKGGDSGEKKDPFDW